MELRILETDERNKFHIEFVIINNGMINIITFMEPYIHPLSKWVKFHNEIYIPHSTNSLSFIHVYGYSSITYLKDKIEFEVSSRKKEDDNCVVIISLDREKYGQDLVKCVSKVIYRMERS